MRGARILAACAVVVAVELTACSSGDGPGGGDGLSISADRTSLEFVGIASAGAPQSVHFTMTGGSGTYYASMAQDRPGLFTWQVEFTGPTTATATLWASGASAGRTSGNVTFRLCRDVSCSSVVWSEAMPYTVTVFTVGAQSLALTATESLSAAQPISIDPVDSDHLLTASVGPTPWLSVTRDASSGFQVTASAQTLAPGSYQGQVVIASTAGGTTKTVPLTFTVAPALIPPVDATHTLDLAASPSGSMPVAFRDGLAPAWTATTNRAWLALTRASGAGASAIEYTIDPAGLGSVANWSSDVATIVISPAGMAPATVRLTLQCQLPEVYMISPAAIAAGTGTTVHVFGRGLSQLASEDGISVSGAGVTTTTQAGSDQEASIAVPALAAGPATVSVPNPFGIPTRAADLAVNPEGPWSAAKVARTGASEVRCAVFDPLRNAVYAANTGQATVDRYRLVSGVWAAPDSISVPSLGEVGLSADRRMLYVTSGQTLQALDPDTLQTMAGPFKTSASLVPGLSRTSCIQTTNNAHLWFNEFWGFYFDALSSSFASFVPPYTIIQPGYYASPDGARMVIEQPNGWAPPYVYTSANGQFAQPAIPAVYNGGAPSSRDGSVVVVDRYRVYGSDTWTLRGTLPGDGDGIQVSPDGTKVYQMIMATTYDVARIDVYDSSTVLKLGEIPVADQASKCSSALLNCYPVLLIGPQGDVLLMVGNQGLVVLPIPPELAGPP